MTERSSAKDRRTKPENHTNKTTSRELSEALKEAGAKQDSELVYVKDNQDGWLLRRRWLVKSFPQTRPSSFDCHELLEELPILSRVEKTQDSIFKADNWWLDVVEIEKSPAEALGKLYLWCLENGHCERSEV